jgi:hypothetical protein
MNRRDFLKGLTGALVVTTAGVVLPYVPERIYSFGRKNPYDELDISYLTPEQHEPYTSTFTVQGLTEGQDYVAYIDNEAGGFSESFTYAYQTDRTLHVRVREGGRTLIRPFEVAAVIESQGVGIR